MGTRWGLARVRLCAGSPTLGPWGGAQVRHAHTYPQLFITVMDKLRLEIRAMDEVPLRGGAGRGGARPGWAGSWGRGLGGSAAGGGVME